MNQHSTTTTTSAAERLAERAVPARLREAYSAAPTLPDRELLPWAQKALEIRANSVQIDAHGPGFVSAPGGIRDEVIKSGIQPGDFDLAQHLQRLDVANAVAPAIPAVLIPAVLVSPRRSCCSSPWRAARPGRPIEIGRPCIVSCITTDA